MKKTLFYQGAIILLPILVFVVCSFKTNLQSREEYVGRKIANEFKDQEISLHSYGWRGLQGKSRISYMFQSSKKMDVSIDAKVFLDAQKKLVSSLNNEKALVQQNEGDFSRTNVDFSILWKGVTPQDVTTGNEGISSSWKGKIIFHYLNNERTKEITHYIPYDVFVQLVEERRFDEILHYGE